MNRKKHIMDFGQFAGEKREDRIEKFEKMLEGFDLVFLLDKLISAIPEDAYDEMYENVQNMKKYMDVKKLNEEKGRLKRLVGKNPDEYLTSSDTLKLGQIIASMEGSDRRDHVGIINFLGASCRIHHEIKNSYLNTMRSKVKAIKKKEPQEPREQPQEPPQKEPQAQTQAQTPEKGSQEEKTE